MRILLKCIFALGVSVATASPATYKIETKILVDGKIVSAPRITTYGNEESEIFQSSEDKEKIVSLKVVASDVSDAKVGNGILLKMHLVYKADSRAIDASPELIVKSGEEVTITPSSNSNFANAKLQMKVVATRD